MKFVVIALGHILVVEKWSACALFAREIAQNGWKPLVRRATEQEAEAYYVNHVACMPPKVSPKVLSIMEDLISRGPRDGRRGRVGAARTVPLAYSHR